jgi:hypothetical protein
MHPLMLADETEAFVEPTLYHGAMWVRVSMSVFGLIACMCSLGGFSSHVGVGGWLATLGIWLCVGTAWLARARRMGIRVERDRVVAVYAIGKRRFPPSEVAGFSVRLRGNSGGTRVVFIELASGKRVPVPSVSMADWGPFKSKAIVWAEGSTTDPVSRLTAHVERVRAGSARAAFGA